MNRGLLIAAIAVVLGVNGWSAPFTPQRDDQVLERIPLRLTGTMVELRALRAKISGDPADSSLATELAARYIEIGRAELDPRFFGYAEAALEPWLGSPAAPTEVVVLGAIIKQQRHDFGGALEDLDTVLKRDPRNAQAWLSRAMVLQVRGEQREAMAHCATLGLLPGSDFPSAVCLAKSLSLIGKAEAGYTLLQQQLERKTDEPAPQRVWALTILGEIAARRGQPEAAERHFLDALAVGQRDTYLLASFADFLLDEDQAERVTQLLADETRVDRSLLTLTLAEKQLGLAVEPRIDALRGRFEASRLRGDTLHLGDQARFALHLLDTPGAALELAVANWDVQREPRDARIVLEASLAAGDTAAAAPVLEFIERHSLEDVELAALVARIPRSP